MIFNNSFSFSLDNNNLLSVVRTLGNPNPTDNPQCFSLNNAYFDLYEIYRNQCNFRVMNSFKGIIRFWGKGNTVGTSGNSPFFYPEISFIYNGEEQIIGFPTSPPSFEIIQRQFNTNDDIIVVFNRAFTPWATNLPSNFYIMAGLFINKIE